MARKRPGRAAAEQLARITTERDTLAAACVVLQGALAEIELVATNSIAVIAIVHRVLGLPDDRKKPS